MLITSVVSRMRSGLAVLLAIASAACQRESSPADTERGQGSSTELVQWLFRPSPLERDAIDSVLGTIREQYYPQGSLLDGQLDTLPSVGPTREYLLIASIPAREGTAEIVRLFILSPPSASAPSPMLIEDRPNRFAVTEITDLDGDGHADVAYCIWTGEFGDAGTPMAVGYAEDEWYEVHAAQLPECGPLPAP